MERARALSTTRVALFVGFLFLLGLAAVALLLLLSASPAHAQTSDTQTESAQSVDAQTSDAPASHEGDASSSPTTDDSAPASDSNDATLLDLDTTVVDLQVRLPEPIAAVVDPVGDLVAPIVEPVVQPLLPALPVDGVQVALPFVRADVSVAPVLERASLPPSSPSQSAPAPVADLVPPAPPGAPGLGVLGSGASTNASVSVARGWSSWLSPSASAFRAVDASPGEGGAGAPLSGFPSAVGAFGTWVLSSSTAHDFGQGLLLFGVVAVGILLGLGRGRRLLVETFGWLRAPWCLLLERPG
jgi:cytoskeletal protein RodZ